MLTSIASIRWRHGCPTCSVATRSQAPKPHRGAPKGRGFTARAWTELPFIRRQPDPQIIVAPHGRVYVSILATTVDEEEPQLPRKRSRVTPWRRSKTHLPLSGKV